MKKIMLLIFILGFFLFLVGCETQKVVTHIEVEQDYDMITIDGFYYDDIMVKLTYEGGDTKEVPLDKDWISASDYRSLFHPGIKIIQIKHQDNQAKLIFNIASSPLYETLRYYHQVLLTLEKTSLTYEAFMMSHREENQYIKSMDANEEGHLIITYDDDSTKDLGYIADTHEVTFYDLKEDIIETSYVFNGFSALSPGLKNLAYKDSNWSKDFSNIRQDEEIYEIYIPIDVQVSVILNHTMDQSSYLESIIIALESYNDLHSSSSNIYSVIGPTRDNYIYTIQNAIMNGSQFIILEDFLFDSVAHELQFLYPSIKFIIIEGNPTNIISWDTMETYDGAPPNFEINENLLNLHFNVQEGGFLAGYVAVKDGHETLGFIGGLPIPMIMRYGIGFVAGAYYAAKEMNLTHFYFEPAHFEFTYDFSASTTAYFTANDFYHSGVDLIYAVTGRGVESIISAAEQYQNRWIINTDQYIPSYHILATLKKDLSYILLDILDNNYNGLFEGGMTHMKGMVDQAFVLDFPDTEKLTLLTEEDYNAMINQMMNHFIQIPNSVEALDQFIQDLGYDGYQIVDKIDQFI